jgi:hypothetical protein
MQATTHLNSSAPSVLKGKTEPRLQYPKPLGNRVLTPETSKGFELIRFARDVLKEPFDPWQEWLAIHALELNEDGTYRFNIVLVLVARQNGKTHFQKALALWKLYMGEASRVLGVAQNLDLALESMRECVTDIEANDWLVPEFAGESRNNGREHFLLHSGAKYFVKATTGKGPRGHRADHIIWDEIRTQQDMTAWAAVSKTMMARPDPQLWAISNAGDMRSVLLNRLRAVAIGDETDEDLSISIALFEWSAKDGCDVTDREQWAQANPALGYRIQEKMIELALHSDDTNVFRTEVLCQRVDVLESAVDMDAWTAGYDKHLKLKGLPVYACVDVSQDDQHVTLALAAKDAQGLNRVGVAGSWRSIEDARKALPGLVGKIKPVALGWFPNGHTAALGAELRALDAVELKGQAQTEACMSFAALVKAQKVKHNGDLLITNHLKGAMRLNVGDGWRFQRRGEGQADAAYAVAGAVHLLRTTPEEIPPAPFAVVV